MAELIATYAIAYQALLVVATVVLLGVAAFVKAAGQKGRAGAAIGGFVTAGLLIVSVMAGSPIVPSTECELNPNLPQCQPVNWNVMMASTMDTDVDVTTEVLDSEGATACDAGSPDLNGAIAAINTQAFLDENDKKWIIQSDSDDDVARSATGFQEIDCPLMAVSIALVGGRDLNGDGLDTIVWGARLVQVGPATFHDGNQTQQNTVFWDPDFGWECGFLTEGNIWVNAFGTSGRFASSMPSSGPWLDLGGHSGAGAAFDTGSFACVFDTTTGSPAGYTIPSQIGSVEWSATVEWGTQDDAHAYTVEWVLQSRT
jgi:hypothetical protein